MFQQADRSRENQVCILTRSALDLVQFILVPAEFSLAELQPRKPGHVPAGTIGSAPDVGCIKNCVVWDPPGSRWEPSGGRVTLLELCGRAAAS